MPPQIARDIKSFQSIKPQSSSATVDGVGVDTAGYDEAVIVLDSGTTAATGTLDVKMQESDDNSTFVDIAGAAFAQITPTNDDAIYIGTLRLEGARKRYIRPRAVAATAASLYGVSIHLAQGEQKPAQTPAFAV